MQNQHYDENDLFFILIYNLNWNFKIEFKKNWILKTESLISSAGYQVWDRRNKFSPEKVDQVNFLVENEDI